MQKTKNIFVKMLLLTPLLLAPLSGALAASSSDFTLIESDLKNSATSTETSNLELLSVSPNIQTLAYAPSYILEPDIGENMYCGNNKKELLEECDGTDLGGLNCSDYGYDTGTLSCDTGCKISTINCYNYSSNSGSSGGGGTSYYCGDGIISGNEECDDGNLRNGDGCSLTCHLEDSAALPAHTASEDTSNNTNTTTDPSSTENANGNTPTDTENETDTSTKEKQSSTPQQIEIIPTTHAAATDNPTAPISTETTLQADPSTTPITNEQGNLVCPPCHCAAPNQPEIPFDYFWLIILLITLNTLAYKYLDHFSKNKK